MATDSFDRYLSGEELYGDRMTPSEIAAWFSDEKEAYVELMSGRHYEYPDHAVNMRHGFRHLPRRRFPQVLGIGSAYADEFGPILSRIDEITVVEPSDAYVRPDLNGIPLRYVKPNVDGSLPFPDDRFDLALCLAVLHHIPNVSYVVRELHRTVKPGGYVLIHEPTVSMGDWRNPRPGLTKRERGIPLRVFRGIVSSAGFRLVHEQRCCSSLLYRFADIVHRPVRNSMPLVVLDELLCRFLPKDPPYHPPELVKKVMVTSVFYSLRKPASTAAIQSPRTP